MVKPQSRNRLRVVVALALMAVSVVVMVATSKKAHEFYYPNVRFHEVVTSPVSSFTTDRAGRYEINHDHTLGDLSFKLVEKETGTAVAVHEFGFVEFLANTAGRNGYAFEIEKTGTYELSTQPWPAGAELSVGFCNTRAIAGWTLAGLLFGGMFVGLAFVLLFTSNKTSPGQPSAGSEPAAAGDEGS